jgi:hypothetical protein
LSEDVTIDPTSQLKARIAEIGAQAQKFFQSPEFKALIARLAEVNAKNPHRRPGGTRAELTFGGASNFMVSAALHGMFIGVWSEFELTMEILIMRLSGMSSKNTSILCTPLQSGTKMQILLSLLSEYNNDEKGIALLRKAQELASRNVYVHGFWDGTYNALNLYHREAKSSYTVKKRDKNWHETANHLLDFLEMTHLINTHFNVTSEEAVNYKKSIVDLEPIHASRAEHRRQPRTNSRKAKKTQLSPPPI